MVTTPRLGLPFIAAAQAQKHVTHNAALILLDCMSQCAVKGLDVNDPPAMASAGDSYAIGTSPTGAFASAAGKIAVYDGYAWQFIALQKGFLVFNLGDSQFHFFDGSSWQYLIHSFEMPNRVESFGIGTEPDAVNSFALKLNATLFSARATSEGGSGDMRVVLNKQTTANSVSQLYQVRYSGRAETGLTGDDNFHIKLSSDGANWKDALIGYSASGAIRIDQLLVARSANANKGRIECDFTAPNSVGAVLSETSSSPLAPAILFRKSNSQVGSISLSATGTTYATTSDYRVKINTAPIGGALHRLSQLKPIRFAFTNSPATLLDGFLAHEVAAIVPEAVIGEKNAVDERGEPVLQGLDASRLVPLLVAAIQELAGQLAAFERK